MSDPWWNIRCYLPRREVAKLFTVWRQVEGLQALTVERAAGNDRSSTGTPRPPADD